MSEGQNITGFLLSGILAIVNIILGFIVFPLKKQVDDISKDMSECQKEHSGQLQCQSRDIEYIKRDADKAEIAAKALSECMAEMKTELGRIAFNTDLHSASIAEIKGMVDTLPARIVKEINGDGKK